MDKIVASRGGKSGPALPIAKLRPAYMQVADQLRDVIMSGHISPGERLPVESELTALFGVSRSTIREALRTLASQNLVSTRRGANGGTFVESPSAESLGSLLSATIGLMSGSLNLSVAEMLETRELFEVPAARMAARRRTAEQLETLRSTLGDSDEIDLAHLFEGHKDFHVAIVESSQNRLLSTLATPVFSVLRTRFLRDRAPRQFWDEVAGDHQEIFDAIEARDEGAAGSLMKDHLERLRVTYEEIDPTFASIAEPIAIEGCCA